MSLSFYCSVYRKKQYQQLNKKYEKIMKNIYCNHSIPTNHESINNETKILDTVVEMFELRMIIGEKIEWQSLTKLTKYYSRVYQSIDVLIREKCDMKIIAVISGNCMTLLTWAIREGHNDIAKLLIGIKDKNLRNYFFDSWSYGGNIALFWAVGQENYEIVHQLIESKCDVNIENDEGETALFWAVYSRNHEIIRLLIEAKSNVDHTNIYCYTALMNAVLYGNPECVDMLIRSKCRQDIRNDKDKTALDIAIERRYQKIIDLLD